MQKEEFTPTYLNGLEMLRTYPARLVVHSLEPIIDFSLRETDSEDSLAKTNVLNPVIF